MKAIATFFKDINEYCGRIYCCNRRHEGLLIRHVTTDENGFILEAENKAGNPPSYTRFEEAPDNFIIGKVLYTALQPMSVEVKLLEFERIQKAR